MIPLEHERIDAIVAVARRVATEDASAAQHAGVLREYFEGPARPKGDIDGSIRSGIDRWRAMVSKTVADAEKRSTPLTNAVRSESLKHLKFQYASDKFLEAWTQRKERTRALMVERLNNVALAHHATREATQQIQHSVRLLEQYFGDFVREVEEA